MSVMDGELLTWPTVSVRLAIRFLIPAEPPLVSPLASPLVTPLVYFQKFGSAVIIMAVTTNAPGIMDSSRMLALDGLVILKNGGLGRVNILEASFSRKPCPS